MVYRNPFLGILLPSMRRRLLPPSLLATALAGTGVGAYGGQDSSGTTGAETTAAPCAPADILLEDGRCQPPGLPLDMPCPPGETPLDDGSCEAAGVPPSQCGDGFEADGEAGCKPILPEQPCP